MSFFILLVYLVFFTRRFTAITQVLTSHSHGTDKKIHKMNNPESFWLVDYKPGCCLLCCHTPNPPKLSAPTFPSFILPFFSLSFTLISMHVSLSNWTIVLFYFLFPPRFVFPSSVQIGAVTRRNFIVCHFPTNRIEHWTQHQAAQIYHSCHCFSRFKWERFTSCVTTTAAVNGPKEQSRNRIVTVV